MVFLQKNTEEQKMKVERTDDKKISFQCFGRIL